MPYKSVYPDKRIYYSMKEHEIFKALSEPTRLRILGLLTHGELCVCDLKETLALPQSTVSRHMAKLKLAGLVQDRRAGKWVHYRLRRDQSILLRRLAEYFAALRHEEPFRTDFRKLQKYLKTKQC